MTIATPGSELARFQIDVEDEVLEDLRARLKATRFAPDVNNADMFYGLSTDYMSELVDYWRNDFDWRAAEAEMNAVNQHRVEIDGVPIHFLYERGKGPNPKPIILSHGWPWTFWFWSKLIGPLTDPGSFGGDPNQSFDVVIPSLPSFGFSNPHQDGEMQFWRIADLFNTLMTDVLGYETYMAGGADYGAHITSQLAHKYGANVEAIHLGHDLVPAYFETDRFWDLTAGHQIPEDSPPEMKAAFWRFQDTYCAHVAVHMLEAQTLSHGLHDSPVGMLAWLLQRWRKWSDPSVDFDVAFPKEFIIRNATLFWVTESIGPSIRLYRNMVRYRWQPSHNRQPMIEAPAGFTFLVGDAYPPGATVENRVNTFENSANAKWFDTVYAKAHQQGGHFSPWENADAMIEGIRATRSAVEARATPSA